ncbi:uncharacterized protein BO80DRAFT_484854 [Aspergillus ibericus CBS 121593]|uniref:DUF7732 domain-containing protein n=1 Tax=Aspergillus ibericus CBS 121593 TaxID=1448316 RepID=A0A395H8U9_9EURO|nr:hypothetical protein BO80DRAFT_484854 [Aspergillus ibericus CBS 121593]RAL04371.1 hypothetical protein BO80DRAFT_484854 [Aspergillus ibericus CBS 121593]
MRILWATALVLLLTISATALSIPIAFRDASLLADSHLLSDLAKRRGGGGGGGGGRSGGGSGGRSGSGGSNSRTSSSNVGGSSRGGSGTRPVYGGGYYYAGGARTPYTSGARSPSGVTPYYLPAAAIPFYYPGIWAYGMYVYPYSHGYHYVNDTTHQNESIPMACTCQQYLECGCDDNDNSTYYQSVFNGSQPLNTSMTRVVGVNGTATIYINGTLPNRNDCRRVPIGCHLLHGPRVLGDGCCGGCHCLDVRRCELVLLLLCICIDPVRWA